MALESGNAALALFQCARLSATISERQCEINRNGLCIPKKGVHVKPIMTCQGCAGLGSPAQVTLTVEESEVKKLKHIYCGHKRCYVIVKNEGDLCKKHQGLDDQMEAGTTSGRQEAAAETPSAETAAGTDESAVEPTEASAGAGAAEAAAPAPAANPTAATAADEDTAAGVAPAADADPAGVAGGPVEPANDEISEKNGVAGDVLEGPAVAATHAEITAEIPAGRKTLLSLISPIEEPPLPPPGLYLDFTGQEDLFHWLKEVSDDANRDILALLSGVARGELYAPKDAVVRGE